MAAVMGKLRIAALLLVAAAMAAAADAPPLMLATRWDRADDPTGWWLSEKYDGVRGYWDGERLWTRGGEMLALPDTLRAQLPPFPVDGELWAGRGRFEETAATVRDAQPGPGWSALHYRVFDAPAQAGPFEARMAVFAAWLAEHPAPQVVAVEQVQCQGRRHLRDFLAAVEQGGGEGVMLRAPGSPYQSGRSPHLRKLKSFEDTEATVVGYRAGKGRLAAMVGALEVELPDGKRFHLGSGLSDRLRREPPPLGTVITFKFQGWTKNGLPRFPVFWRIREGL